VGGTQGDSCQNGKIPFAGQTSLTMSHQPRLRLSYPGISSRDTSTKLARPSNIMANDTRCYTTTITR